MFLVACTAIFFYVYHLQEGGISEKPEDWAYFATYLSGTVGVSAIVATLFAFVTTLSQHQDLIKSQNKMLDEQRTQISLLEEQNKAFEESRKLDLAYKNTTEIFPTLKKAYENTLSFSASPIEDIEPVFFEKYRSKMPKHQNRINDLIKTPSVILEMLRDCPARERKTYIKRSLRPIEAIYHFSCEQISHAPALYEYYEIELLNISVSNNMTSEYLLNIYQAFLIGKGDKTYIQGVNFLGLNDDFSSKTDRFKNWQKIGELIKN